MHQSLSNFTIESETSILLSFMDGSRRRVAASDLPLHVQGRDLEKIRKALHLRSKFIQKVLPPGAMVMLLGATIVLATYDAQHISTIMKNSSDMTSAIVSSHHSAMPPASPSAAQAVTGQFNVTETSTAFSKSTDGGADAMPTDLRPQVMIPAMTSKTPQPTATTKPPVAASVVKTDQESARPTDKATTPATKSTKSSKTTAKKRD